MFPTIPVLPKNPGAQGVPVQLEAPAKKKTEKKRVKQLSSVQGRTLNQPNGRAVVVWLSMTESWQVNGCLFESYLAQCHSH